MASNFCFETFRKSCEAEIELLTATEYLETDENLISVGFSVMLAKRKFEANINFLPTHEPSAK